jgi:hypothetical protein
MCHFVFLANAEPKLKIIKSTISVRLIFFKRMLSVSLICLSVHSASFAEILKKGKIFKLTLSVR